MENILNNKNYQNLTSIATKQWGIDRKKCWGDNHPTRKFLRIVFSVMLKIMHVQCVGKNQDMNNSYHQGFPIREVFHNREEI